MKSLLVLIVTALAAASASAGTLSLKGSLDPDDANSLYVHAFMLAAPSSFLAQSYGFGGTAATPSGTNAAGETIAAGGFDTYLSLFSGQGPSATFLASNDDGSCPPGDNSVACSDSTLDVPSLAAGAYTLVLSAFENFSFAENLGTGTLGDGFIGLGTYYSFAATELRSPNWALDLTAEFAPNAIPEPSSAALFAALGICLTLTRRRCA